MAAKLSGGSAFVGAAFLVDLAQGVTWSFVVCTGVGIATAVGKARAILAGMIALVFAPIAVGLAKAAQKVMVTATGAATTRPSFHSQPSASCVPRLNEAVPLNAAEKPAQ